MAAQQFSKRRSMLRTRKVHDTKKCCTPPPPCTKYTQPDAALSLVLPTHTSSTPLAGMYAECVATSSAAKTCASRNRSAYLGTRARTVAPTARSPRYTVHCEHTEPLGHPAVSRRAGRAGRHEPSSKQEAFCTLVAGMVLLRWRTKDGLNAPLRSTASCPWNRGQVRGDNGGHATCAREGPLGALCVHSAGIGRR